MGAQRGSNAELYIYPVASIEQLQAEHGPFEAVIAAAGAAAGVLPEIGEAPDLRHLQSLSELERTHQSCIQQLQVEHGPLRPLWQLRGRLWASCER